MDNFLKTNIWRFGVLSSLCFGTPYYRVGKENTGCRKILDKVVPTTETLTEKQNNFRFVMGAAKV